MGNFLEDIIEKDLAENNVTEIVTRFPPEPNGYLHIGHAKSICLNFGLAKKYGGRCNLRFDDTNPVKEDDEFVRSIVNDVCWLLGIKDGIEPLFGSDYFDEMYRVALILINKGLAYVDDLTPEQMREMRGTLTEPGKISPNRNRPIEENLKLFEDMRSGKVGDGELVLRAKIDMASPNINMRDPIIYRVINSCHHRQKDKWCIYPMYDLAHPIEDAVEGVTHSICTMEFEDHRPLYDWVLDNAGYEKRPHQYEFARLNMERTIMSKRYLKKLVDEGFVDGWDDPRMPTLSGLRRRGYTPESIREFCSRAGVAKANSESEVSQLESCIREELNGSAPRAMAVLDPVELIITNLPDDYSEQLEFEFTPGDDPETRTIGFSNRLYIERDDYAEIPPPKYKRLTAGAYVRLKSAYIVKCTGAEYDSSGNLLRVLCELIKDTKSGRDSSGIKAKGVIHWVDAKTASAAEIRLYDYLLDADADKSLDFNERLNKDSLKIKNSKIEPYLVNAEPGSRYQFLRQGYFILDSLNKKGEPVFNCIVALKDSKKKKEQQ